MNEISSKFNIQNSPSLLRFKNLLVKKIVTLTTNLVYGIHDPFGLTKYLRELKLKHYFRDIADPFWDY